MSEKTKKDFWEKFEEESLAIWSIFFVFLVLFILFFTKLGNPIIDCGREVFIPFRLLNGEVLFKDIFCIYGPFSYYFNAACYKLFGTNLAALYVVGGLLALNIIYGVYFISREFVNKPISLSLAFFIMTVCAFSPGIFNFIFPYSYAMLWALFGFLFALLFLIKYLKNPQQNYAALVFLFWGLSIVNKQDYLIFIVPMLFVFCCFRPLKHPRALLYLFVFPIFTLLALLVNKVSFSDVAYGIGLINKMFATKSLKFFYTHSVGLYFDSRNFYAMLGFAVRNILIFTIFACSVLYSRKIRYKFLRILSLAGISFLTFLYAVYMLPAIEFQFAFFPALVSLILLYNLFLFCRDSCDNKEESPYLLLLLSAVLASIKNFYFLNLGLYGTFAMCVLAIAVVVSAHRFLSKKMYGDKQATLAITLLLSIICFVNLLHNALRYTLVYTTPIKTSMGKLTNTVKYAGDVNELIAYVLKYTNPEDKIVVLPEGQLINFLTKRDCGTYYDSLTPLYFETFGEDRIIKDFKNLRPQYIVLSDRDTTEYGAREICKDYGLNFCKFVNTNYQKVAGFGSVMKFAVYKYKGSKYVK